MYVFSDKTNDIYRILTSFYRKIIFPKLNKKAPEKL